MGRPGQYNGLYFQGAIADFRLYNRALTAAEAILAGVSAWGMGKIATGFFVASVFLVVGCFLDAIPAIIIVGAILQPLAMEVGIHPVHFAMIGIVSLAFGLVTPPYGLCLMIACHVAGMKIGAVIKDTLIMLLPMLAVLGLVIMWPDVSLILPRLISPEFLQETAAITL